MIRGTPTDGTRHARWLTLGLALLTGACTQAEPPADLLEAAIQARGGALTSLSRDSELRVHYGLPGVWRWRYAARGSSYRLSVKTTSAEQHYAFDGTSLRSYVGSQLVTTEPAASACLRQQASWLALSGLDLLTDSTRFAHHELPPELLPEGIARGLRVRCKADGSEYDLHFDAELRLVAAEGPIAVPALGEGRLQVRYEDFREAEGYRLPFVSRYRFNTQPFFDEYVERYVPNDPALSEDPFRSPGAAVTGEPGTGS